MNYNLHFTTTIPGINILPEGIRKFPIEKVNEKSTRIMGLDTLGFDMYILESFSFIFEQHDQEITFSKMISFRINKEFDPIEYKKNLLKIVSHFIEMEGSEFVFLFNGELVILQKLADAQLFWNTNSGFWSNGLELFLDEKNAIGKEYEIL